MLRCMTRRPAMCGAVAAILLVAAPGAIWAQTAVEDDPVLGPLLDTLTGDEATGAGAVGVEEAEDGDLAEIAGFRSARFGMTENEVLAAIAEDFGVAAADVARETNRLERTQSLVVEVEDLLPDSGTAAVAYILGYQSGALIQVNVIWGAPVDADYESDTLIVTGGALQRFFAEQRYVEGSAFANVMLNDGTLVLFTGSDPDGRQATLTLVTREVAPSAETADPGAAAPEDEAADEPAERTLVPVALRLSYVADPDEPDIFRIAPGAF